jgi:Ca2+/Na+ antiporter
MYFAPALEDLCIKWDVPKRTAAALFVALANGAPDLAATGYMFKQGQGDMAYGALLGAAAYVCMNVIGMIILLKPKVAMQATPALVRDIFSFLGMLCLLFPIFLSGLSWEWVLVLNGSYAILTCACLSLLA